ncbi:MAG: capsule assembly Wzi family protein [bacterium]|nr:capsule assembly Wzi family protein [bacterium]
MILILIILIFLLNLEPLHAKIDSIYFKPILINKNYVLEENFARSYDKKTNFELGIKAKHNFLKDLNIYLNPELINGNVKLLEGYLDIDIRNIKITLGKKTLWFGPGLHSSMLLSNNTEPFKLGMLSNNKPTVLPYLGKTKFFWFLTRLEEDRVIPNPYLTGIRVNFTPFKIFNFSLNRVIIFGGDGREKLSISDYWKVFLASHENEPGKLDNNQLAGFDFSIELSNYLPIIKSFTIYGDFVGEDEAGGLPCKWGRLYGVSTSFGKTNLILEYANNSVKNARCYFYKHHIYRNGYTYKGRVIGHHMGTDAEDLYLNIDYDLGIAILALEYDIENSDLFSNSIKTKKRYKVKIKNIEINNTNTSLEYYKDDGLNYFRISCDY